MFLVITMNTSMLSGLRLWCVDFENVIRIIWIVGCLLPTINVALQFPLMWHVSTKSLCYYYKRWIKLYVFIAWHGAMEVSKFLGIKVDLARWAGFWIFMIQMEDQYSARGWDRPRSYVHVPGFIVYSGLLSFRKRETNIYMNFKIFACGGLFCHFVAQNCHRPPCHWINFNFACSRLFCHFSAQNWTS